MSYKIERTRLYIFGFLLFGTFLLSYVASTYGQSADPLKPLSMEEVSTALKESKTGLPTTNRVLKKQIEERGVAFEINQAIEARLRDEGAVDDLVKAIRRKLSEPFTKRAEACAKEDFECRISNYNQSLAIHPEDSSNLIER
jgi:hypothetical protein